MEIASAQLVVPSADESCLVEFDTTKSNQILRLSEMKT